MPGDSQSNVNKHNPLVVAFRKEPFIKISVVPLWQQAMKRLVDVIISGAGLIILSPLLIYIAIRIKLDSKGAVFYLQQRIGYLGFSFTIFKFRSMYEESEVGGPMLSHPNDVRVTRWGTIMRKWKLDELPQLLNVLIGDMSLVGPRPERKYYIDKVDAIYPYFRYLHQVKPGLTSLGMIRFGYAQTVSEIIQRMKYDISYLENYSLMLDFQILFYTLPAIIKGRIFSTSLKIGPESRILKLYPLN